jgi:hypothetical protein
MDTLDKMLEELDNLMTQYINTRDILREKQAEEESAPDYVPPVQCWLPTINSQLENIGVHEKGDEINKFLKDYKDKYGKDDTYYIMNKKIDERYKFFQKHIGN